MNDFGYLALRGTGAAFFLFHHDLTATKKADDVPGVTTDKLAYTKVPSDLLAKFV